MFASMFSGTQGLPQPNLSLDAGYGSWSAGGAAESPRSSRDEFAKRSRVTPKPTGELLIADRVVGPRQAGDAAPRAIERCRRWIEK